MRPALKLGNAPEGPRRILVGIALLASAVLLPWWTTALLAALALAVSPAEEVIIAGVLVDALYAAPIVAWGGLEFAATMAALCAYLAAYPVRAFLRTTFRRT